ncbi:hypothetical protein [uncultured Methanobrevibacter sp.]|uniref:hypothetical protein n=1 Tax=uncultured Methanobrevibacter sp. TaxID=253161 RepID=UPI0025F89368|nr:hypothetical protein [uncultured Methanobrevibacter sp.]
MSKINNIIRKLKNDKKLNKSDILFLYDYLQKVNNSNKKDIVLNLINQKGLGKILFNEYKHFMLINNLSNELDLITNELKIVFKPNFTVIDLKNDLQIKDNDLHKFIKIYSIFEVLDKIYNSNNKVIVHGYNTLKDFITNTDNVVAFKIDLDLLKSNEHKFKSLNYCKVIIYKYDNTIVYYLMNKSDLVSLNLKYAYDYNNLLSYYLDYKFKHYYDIFNDKNKLDIAFNNLNTYNRVLVNKTKNNNDLKVNKSFKYNNEYYRFNDLFDLDLDLEYLDLDLNDYLKQLDLDLISLDNDLDYLNLLEKEYQYLNDLYLDLDLKYNDLKNDILNYKTNSFRYYRKTVNDLHKNELGLFKREIRKQFNYNTFISNNYNLGSFIAFQLGLGIHIDLVDKQHLNDIDNLNFISNDKKIINQILNIFDFIINRYNNKINNELYNKNYLNIEKVNKHNTKNKNTDLEQIKNGTKNYCYELTNNYFSELNKRYFKII